jgi:folate-binding protein YgfZ
MDDVELVDRSHELGEVGVYGDDAAATVEKFSGVSGERLLDMAPYAQLSTQDGLLIARDPQLGVPGWRVISAPGVWPPIGNALSEQAREVLRVEAGTARYGVDLDEERLIVEANLEDAISFDKGCYLGQEVVVRATSRGRVNRKLVGLVLSGPVSVGAKLSSSAHADAGHITSSVVSDRMGGAIALAYVHRAALDAGIPIDVEGGRKAMVVELPFTSERARAARASM